MFEQQYPDAIGWALLLVNDETTAEKPPAPSRKGWFMRDGMKVPQEMNYTTVTGEIRRKGMKTLLTEAGVNVDGLNGDCSLCKAERSRGFEGVADVKRRGCCMRRILKFRPDFMEQKNMLKEVLQNLSCMSCVLGLFKYLPMCGSW